VLGLSTKCLLTVLGWDFQTLKIDNLNGGKF